MFSLIVPNGKRMEPEHDDAGSIAPSTCYNDKQPGDLLVEGVSADPFLDQGAYVVVAKWPRKPVPRNSGGDTGGLGRW